MLKIYEVLVMYCLLYLIVPQYLSKASFIHVWLFQWGDIHVARAGNNENSNT